MTKAIFEILEEAAKLKTVEERAAYLQQHNCEALRKVLEGTFNPAVNWLLPEGAPPFKKNDIVGTEPMLHNYARKLYLFVEGGQPNLKPAKREFLFIEMLESLHPKDADIVIGMKDKKMPIKGITKNVVKKAFPQMPLGD